MSDAENLGNLLELHEEIDLLYKEVGFWFNRANQIEKELEALSESGFDLDKDNKEDLLITEYGQVLARMIKEDEMLKKFTVKYNKEAKKLGLPLLED